MVTKAKTAAKRHDRGGALDLIWDLAVRLMRGETIEVEDASGRRWRATQRRLSEVARAGETRKVMSSDAFDVACRLALEVARAEATAGGRNAKSKRRRRATKT